MSHREPTSLVIAVRVYPDLKDAERDVDKRQRGWKRPDAMFVFDTETRTDRTQRLTFGSYRFIVAGQCVKGVLRIGGHGFKRIKCSERVHPFFQEQSYCGSER